MILFSGVPGVLKFGPVGLLPADIAAAGNEDSPLLNDPDLPGDATTELIWALLPSLPGSGTVEVDDEGGFSHAGAADGTYATDYRILWMPQTGATGADEGTITTTFGSGGIAAAGIPSAEACGSPDVQATVVAAGIASAEEIGSPVVGAQIAAAGIATAEAFGAPAVQASVAATGIATGEAIGSPAVGAQVSAAGVATAEAFGSPALRAQVQATGIASAEAFGDVIIGEIPEHPITCTGIASGEAFGQPTVQSSDTDEPIDFYPGGPSGRFIFRDGLLIDRAAYTKEQEALREEEEMVMECITALIAAGVL